MVATRGDVLLHVSNPPPIVAIKQLYKHLAIDFYTYCHVVPIATGVKSNCKSSYREQNNAFRKCNRRMVKLHKQSCLESTVQSLVQSNSRVLLSQGP